ncbi:hypothetical protein BMI85_16175 [Thioclava sp. DLFJ4-1]|nr:hypothetical protein BMI85_16175 [Thioclava sp. DLFJ4-1]
MNGGIVRDIAREVSYASGVKLSAILGPSRLKEHVRARDMVIYAAKRMGLSASQIGRELDRDHSTIIVAIQREEKRRAPE